MHTTGYETLSWDTKFFGFPVGAVSVIGKSPEAVHPKLFNLVQSPPCRLLYIHLDPEDLLTQEYVTQLGARLVDRKVVFGKKIAVRQFPDSYEAETPVESYVEREINELNELAFLAGQYSRFRTDSEFSERDFRRLYTSWIKRSISGAIADKVLATRDRKNLPTSLITLACNKGIGRIGLLAVRSDQQGMGLGLLLVNQALEYFSHKHCTTAEVVTQVTNTAACRLYEKSGFIPVQSSHTYHLWFPDHSTLNNC